MSSPQQQQEKTAPQRMDGDVIQTKSVLDAFSEGEMLSLTVQDTKNYDPVMAEEGDFGEIATKIGKEIFSKLQGNFTIFLTEGDSYLAPDFLIGAHNPESSYRFIITEGGPRTKKQAKVLIFSDGVLLYSRPPTDLFPLSSASTLDGVKEVYLLVKSSTQMFSYDPISGLPPLALIPPPYEAMSAKSRGRLLLMGAELYTFFYHAELGLLDPTKPPGQDNPRLKDSLELFYTMLTYSSTMLELLRIYLLIDDVRKKNRALLQRVLPHLAQALPKEEAEDPIMMLRDAVLEVGLTKDLFVGYQMPVSFALTVEVPKAKNREEGVAKESRLDMARIKKALEGYSGVFYLEDGTKVERS